MAEYHEEGRGIIHIEESSVKVYAVYDMILMWVWMWCVDFGIIYPRYASHVEPHLLISGGRKGEAFKAGRGTLGKSLVGTAVRLLFVLSLVQAMDGGLLQGVVARDRLNTGGRHARVLELRLRRSLCLDIGCLLLQGIPGLAHDTLERVPTEEQRCERDVSAIVGTHATNADE